MGAIFSLADEYLLQDGLGEEIPDPRGRLLRLGLEPRRLLAQTRQVGGELGAPLPRLLEVGLDLLTLQGGHKQSCQGNAAMAKSG